MNRPQKIQWKIPIQNPETVDPWDFFRAFSAWIPDSPEIFIDVADYRHVHDGPLIALIGHYADCFLDAGGGELGIAYSAKRATGDFTALLKTALAACDKLAKDPIFAGKLAFDHKRLTFVANDRALTPNTDEAFAELSELLRAAFPTARISRRPSHPRARLSALIDLTYQNT